MWVNVTSNRRMCCTCGQNTPVVFCVQWEPEVKHTIALSHNRLEMIYEGNYSASKSLQMCPRREKELLSVGFFSGHTHTNTENIALPCQPINRFPPAVSLHCVQLHFAFAPSILSTTARTTAPSPLRSYGVYVCLIMAD